MIAFFEHHSIEHHVIITVPQTYNTTTHKGSLRSTVICLQWLNCLVKRNFLFLKFRPQNEVDRQLS